MNLHESRKGIATPKADLDLIKRRLKIAEYDYKKRDREEGQGNRGYKR